jgi:hypothetical protein
MNQKINQAINGLISSLCLIAGLARFAERIDPLRRHGGNSLRSVAAAAGSEDCSYPCEFFARVAR